MRIVPWLWMGRPSSRRQVMTGSGWPVALQRSVVFWPSVTMTSPLLSLSTMSGGTVEWKIHQLISQMIRTKIIKWGKGSTCFYIISLLYYTDRRLWKLIKRRTKQTKSLQFDCRLLQRLSRSLRMHRKASSGYPSANWGIVDECDWRPFYLSRWGKPCGWSWAPCSAGTSIFSTESEKLNNRLNGIGKYKITHV